MIFSWFNKLLIFCLFVVSFVVVAVVVAVYKYSFFLGCFFSPWIVWKWKDCSRKFLVFFMGKKSLLLKNLLTKVECFFFHSWIKGERERGKYVEREWEKHCVYIPGNFCTWIYIFYVLFGSSLCLHCREFFMLPIENQWRVNIFYTLQTLDANRLEGSEYKYHIECLCDSFILYDMWVNE